MTTAAVAAPALEADNLHKRFGDTRALAGVSLTVFPGELVALIGESGSGKTTLLRSWNRLTEVDEGRVEVGGTDVTALDPIELRRRMGYVPQVGGLLPHWRVLRNVTLVPWLRGLPDGERLARRALELVGLDPAAFGARWPHELSGGQRQRVAVARALAAEPAVILLDEPFGALDAITRTELQTAFRALQRRLAVTAVLVTHDLHEALSLADRVAVMRAGTIEQVATPDALVASPATDYVAELLLRARVAR